MSKLKISITIFILILLSYLIVTIFIKDEQNLGNGYYFLPDYEAIDIGYSYGNMLYKSDKKNHFNNIIIFSDIKKINFNNYYIIVLQRPNKKLVLKQIEDDLTLWNNYYTVNKKDSIVTFNFNKISLVRINNIIEKVGVNNISKVADSIFNNQEFYKKIFERKDNYYIVNKKNDSIFGQLTFDEFLRLKKKKNIALDFEN